MRPLMTNAQKLKENRKILKQLETELETFRDVTIPVIPKYLNMFPSKTPQEVRATMIRAREADIVNYEHIIADYESKLQAGGS